MTIRINANEIRNLGLIEWMKNNYKELSKKQIFDIAISYIKFSYLRNGSAYIDITNEVIKELGDDE